MRLQWVIAVGTGIAIVAVVAITIRSCSNQHYRPHGHQDISVDISPDGRTLLFNAIGKGGRDLYLLDLENLGVVRVAATFEYEVNPKFSPDGKSIVYAAGLPGDRADHIFMRSLDGPDIVQLTSEDANDAFPRCSPDEALVVFARDKTYDWGGLAANWAPGGVICVVSANGTNLRQLTPDEAIGYDPHFSPDGNYVWFWTPKGWHEIEVEEPHGLRKLAIQADPGLEFSPDGELIAYSQGQYAPDCEIFVCDREGENVRQVTRMEEGCFKPVFTPDGLRVFFLRETWPTGPTGSPKFSLWETRVDGTEVHQIANPRLFDDPLNWQPSSP
jgi:TolB protein